MPHGPDGNSYIMLNIINREYGDFRFSPLDKKGSMFYEIGNLENKDAV